MVETPRDREQPTLEELQRIAALSERRRTKALEGMPHSILRETLEANPRPMVMYENHRVSYANPAAIAKMGYSYEELMMFNDISMDTSAGKKRLDDILKTCEQQGWDEIDLDLTFETKDKKRLHIDPHLHHAKANSQSYWIAYITHVEKTDPKSLKQRALSVMQRVFSRDQIYRKASENVAEQFVYAALKEAADPKYNIVFDFKKAQRMESGVPALLANMAVTDTFKDHMFLVNVHENLYFMLHKHKFPEANINRYRRAQPLTLATQ